MRAVLSYVRVSLNMRIVIFPNADIKFHIIVTMKIFQVVFNGYLQPSAKR
jgi:hypothetical protein